MPSSSARNTSRNAFSVDRRSLSPQFTNISSVAEMKLPESVTPLSSSTGLRDVVGGGVILVSGSGRHTSSSVGHGEAQPRSVACEDATDAGKSQAWDQPSFYYKLRGLRRIGH